MGHVTWEDLVDLPFQNTSHLGFLIAKFVSLYCLIPKAFLELDFVNRLLIRN